VPVSPDERNEMQVTCSVCGEEAGSLLVEDGLLVRDSFTSRLTQGASERVLELVRDRDVAGLYAYDRELTPFWCPDCGRSYCGNHWRTNNVFDDETSGLDCIRGTCPEGHERMLED
jgi:hypothetical protein